VHAQSDFVVLLYATAPPMRDVHGIGTHMPATHDTSVRLEVTMAVSPPVWLLHGGRPDGLLVSICTENESRTGAGGLAGPP
jgi:hypothetical protein